MCVCRAQTSSMESRKQRPPALQLPPDSDGPLATLIDGLEEGGSGKKSSGRTIPAERPQMTDRQAAAAGATPPCARLCLGFRTGLVLAASVIEQMQNQQGRDLVPQARRSSRTQHGVAVALPG